MAASTKRFTLTSATYVDVSEGATLVFGTLEFDRQRYRAVRIALGTSLPSVGTTHYQGIDPGVFQVANENYSQEVPFKFEIGAGDAVYMRAESESFDVVVHRI